MKNWIIGIVIFIFVIGGGIGLSYAFGWIGIHQTSTIGKAQKDAERKVFEQTQSYVFGKKQEALKLYKEWTQAETQEDKDAIKELVFISFAEFDENKLDGKLKVFIYNCKYQ